MRIRLIARRPLGAIVRAFPFAAHLAKAGHEVFIECPKEASGLLKLVDYAQWHDPASAWAPAPGGEPDTFVMQILGPDLHRYRSENPPKRWSEFLEAQAPKLFKGMKREIVFTHLPELAPVLAKYGLPAQFDLACPVPSIETGTPVHFGVFESWLGSTLKMEPGKCFLLAGQGWRPNRNFVCVQDLAELATLIRAARTFATVNAMPAAIASARFNGKPLRESWHHVSQVSPRERYQDDILTKEQTRWEVNYSGSVPQIALQRKA